MSKSGCEFKVVIGGVEVDGILIGKEEPVGVILRLVEGGKVRQWPAVAIRPGATSKEIHALSNLWLAWVQLERPQLRSTVKWRRQLRVALSTVRQQREEAAAHRAEVRAVCEATSHAREVATANAEVADAQTALAVAEARLAKAEATAAQVNGNGK